MKVLIIGPLHHPKSYQLCPCCSHFCFWECGNLGPLGELDHILQWSDALWTSRCS